ncbi:hypothetical protein [Clostridium weizhouense]|uniref:Uncharacterized protein n=1 Tax=Clostridium weizhouense TaxID=2859781 RepID=A0ABS7AR56_9CLOT|nr:hypothetical protein [Clostridium weizhouense]MBW6411167.1 hypothetical protein [Clostridium weizhouense]
MKFKLFIIIFLISTFAFIQTPKAAFVSDTYKQGVYNISEKQPFRATARLLEVPPTTFIIIDSNGNQKYFKRFDSINEPINVGFIKDGDLIIIAGEGQIALSRS